MLSTRIQNKQCLHYIKYNTCSFLSNDFDKLCHPYQYFNTFFSTLKIFRFKNYSLWAFYSSSPFGTSLKILASEKDELQRDVLFSLLCSAGVIITTSTTTHKHKYLYLGLNFKDMLKPRAHWDMKHDNYALWSRT